MNRLKRGVWCSRTYTPPWNWAPGTTVNWLVATSGSGLFGSTDAVTWSSTGTSATAAMSATINDIMKISSGWLGAGNGGLATSTDGITWVSRVGFGTTHVNAVAYGGTTVAPPFTKTMYASSSQSGQPVYGCFYGDTAEHWVLGNGSTMKTSTDLVTWTTRSLSGIRYAKYDGTRWVAASYTFTYVSTDAITWTTVDTGNKTLKMCYSSTPSQHYVGVGGIGATGIIKSSTDGITWVTRTSFATQAFSAIEWGNGMWLAGAYGDGSLRSSTDGITWATVAISGYKIKSIAYGNGHWLVAGGNIGPTIYSSTDLVAWEGNPQTGFASNKVITGLVYGNGAFYVVGADTPRRSVDGYVWTTLPPYGVNNNLTWSETPNGGALSASYTNYGAYAQIWPITNRDYTSYAAVGDHGEVRLSTDAVTWTTSTLTPRADIFGDTSYSSSLINSSSMTDIDYGAYKWLGVASNGLAALGDQTKDALGTFTTLHGTLGITWTTRLSLAGWNHIVYGSGTTEKWVAACLTSGNRIYSSTDAITWTTRVLTTRNVWDLAYGPTTEHWVYVGGYHTIFSSTDAITWTSRTTDGGDSNDVFRAVLHDGSNWIALHQTNTMWSSTDAITWTTLSSNPNLYQQKYMAYGGGKYVTGGAGTYSSDNYGSFGYGWYSVSTDGVSWTTVPWACSGYTGYQMNRNISGIAYGGGKFVATILGTWKGWIETSTDGMTWTTALSDETGYLTYFGGSPSYDANNHIWMLASGQQLWASTDAITWVSYAGAPQARSNPSAGGGAKGTANNGAGLWAVAGQYCFATSQNGTLFDGSGVYPYKLSSAYWDNVLVTLRSGVPWWTTDVTNWNKLSLIPVISPYVLPIGGNEVLYALGSSSSLWVAGGYSSTGFGIKTSTDGLTWTSRTSTFGVTTIKAVAYGSTTEHWVAGGGAGQLRSSTDGTTWTTRTSTFGTSNINSVVYAGGIWVAVGAAGKIRTSTDAITWTTRTSTFGTTNVNGVAYGSTAQHFVAVGEYGQIRSSTDAITWTTRTSGTTQTFFDVTFGNGLWVAGGYSILLTSTDAITWTSRTPYFNGISRLGYGDGRYVATYDNGNNVQSSTDAVTWTSMDWSYAYAIAKPLSFNGTRWMIINHINGIGTAIAQIFTWKGYDNRNSLTGYWTDGTISAFTSTNGMIYWGTAPYLLPYDTGMADTIRKIDYRSGTWLAVGSNAAYKSTDLVTWTTQAIGAAASGVTDIEST